MTHSLVLHDERPQELSRGVRLCSAATHDDDRAPAGRGKVTRTLLTIASLVVTLSAAAPACDAAENAVRSTRNAPIATRLCWQDRRTQQLHMADVVAGEEWSLKPHTINGFPKLDTETQNLVQMRHAGNVLLVGVRDNADGSLCSGWVAVRPGVIEEVHGDHTHWRYRTGPKVLRKKLDTEQGNPAHLYCYGTDFFLANDRKNGFTWLSAAALANSTQSADGTFYTGGGNHITFARSGRVAYSTWIDGGGPHGGQVDVVDLDQSASSPAYSLKLPTGGIHGATANSGRVFFAPSDGICWLDADEKLEQTADSVTIHHISLGQSAEDDRPLRTGAFSNHRNWVLFSTGRGEQSAIGVIDAAAKKPSVVRIALPATDGLRPTPPQPVLSMGRRYALCFLDRIDSESTDEEQLCIIDLDPDRNRDISDARLLATLPVTPSRIQGHYGHHGISFDAYGRYAFVTEPAQGRIRVLQLKDQTWKATFDVGGHPDTVVAIGGMEFDD